ncbi:MAG: molecular chaperone HtpG [Synechococcales cyanobacterium RU_4_20]|nr:molecular chaperone HtpG [Synechococcales cyanobacterium RU_4_20]
MTVLEQGNITFNTENIFPIIKKSLYSDHEVFFRELVSNAVDAIQKRKMVSYAGEIGGDSEEPTIAIALDKEAKTLTITDNGIGMTLDEVKKYINQVAFSSAEEFIEKYKGGADQPIIGHFGLGFYSAFMVSSQVEIDTLSWREDSEAVHWQCDGSPSFELSSSDWDQKGTRITLHISDDEAEFLEEARIKQLVNTYCDFMPVPISLGEEVLNRQKAIWRESPSNLTDEDYLEFYRYLYPFQEEPLLWVHLNTDYPFLVNGILYFPKLNPSVDVTKGQLKLFCNQVFVSDHCEEIVPKFLLPMRGVIDSPDIPLNVSRSALQMDRRVRGIANFISKKVGDRLKELYNEDRAKYIDNWQDLGTFVKFGAMNDEKFKKQVEDFLIYRTTADLSDSDGEMPAVQVEVQTPEGEDAWADATPKSKNTDPEGRSYTTLQDYLDRNQAHHENRVYYCNDSAAQATYVELHKNQGLEVLFLDAFIDTHFVGFLENEYREKEIKFSRVDSDLDSTLMESDKADEIVDPATNKTKGEQIKEIFEKALAKPTVTIRTEALKGEGDSTPPAIVLLPEEMRRMQEMSAMFQNKEMQFPEIHTLLVNTNHPLIKNLTDLSSGGIVTADGAESPSSELAKMLCQHVYDLALMAQKGFDADGMKAFVERSNQVLTRLTAK